MSAGGGQRRRPSVQVTEVRAARLFQMVRGLTEGPPTRDELLARLGIGLRTFYRELEMLRRCGVRVRLRNRRYEMSTSPTQAEDLLPFPDPRLSFAEMRELAAHPGPAAHRLAGLLERVLGQPTSATRGKKPGGSSGRKLGG